MLRIVTDNASDITLGQVQNMDVDLVFLEIAFEDDICLQVDEADFQTFYDRLQKCDRLPITSRPSPQAYLDIFLDAKEKGEEVLVLTLSSGLSGTIESAYAAKNMAEYNPIYIVDTHQAILTQRILVEMAVRMRSEDYSAAEIAQKNRADARSSSGMRRGRYAEIFAQRRTNPYRTCNDRSGTEHQAGDRSGGHEVENSWQGTWVSARRQNAI